MLDQTYTVEHLDGPAPDWVDASVAEALARFGRWRANLELRDDALLVALPEETPSDSWEQLLADGEQLSTTLQRRLGEARTG